MKRLLDIQPEDRFTLQKDFVDEYSQKKPDFGGNGLGLVVYKRTYARPLDDGTTEEWWQTVKRVVEGVYTVQKWHCQKQHLPWSDRKAQRSAKEMYRLIFEMKFLPPGRGLWAMGTEYLEKNGSTPLYNCAFISTEDINKDFAQPFTFLMDFSMLGVGVGFDTLGAGKIRIKKPKVNSDLHTVEDSRAGWVNLVRRYINAYTGKDTLPADVDYSLVRPAGAPLKGFGGIAAGPEPLIRCVAGIIEILSPLVGKNVTSTAIVDLMNIIGVCVVSGNIRRSAELALGSSLDNDFMVLKDPVGAAKELMSHRWASNNSVVVAVGDDYTKAASLTSQNGEPGYFWIDNARKYGRMGDVADNKDFKVQGLNPCAEITLESGEVCNLVETFPSRHDTYLEYQRTLKFAYLYSKTVTLIPTHNRLTNKVQSRNRRIGLSQSGIIQSMQKIGRREHLRWCDEGYKYLGRLDKQYSDWLGIPRSIKMTTVKPSGTVSQLPGVTPGIHFEHSEYYFRTVRIAKTSALLPRLTSAGYRIEEDQYDPSSMVVYFPIHATNYDRSKSEVTMWEQMKLAAEMQRYWADNAVSVTVTFSTDEGPQIGHALELFESDLKSISFLPMEDHGYVQAPYQTIDKYIYDEAIKKIKPLDLKLDTHEIMDAYCEGDKCEVPFGHDVAAHQMVAV